MFQFLNETAKYLKFIMLFVQCPVGEKLLSAASKSEIQMGALRNNNIKRNERGESDAVNQRAEGAAQETNSPRNSSDPLPSFFNILKRNQLPFVCELIQTMSRFYGNISLFAPAADERDF